ncbi:MULTISPECIES: DsrH/TusB family sulfur relay protein [Aggregatibacter]|jgi:uncharacterized protein HI_0577|uniref:Sulfur transfer complex subunit TusB n=2 Tax=Aggregatibacter aphrophilus TaxID=732 RepID=A0A336N8R1_AGGAP|nr:MULTISPECIES: DsrH/TusB family sulfur metabolism protein [Aggregatibacter]KNE84731.1 hypothetical protein ATCC33389_0208920 [Aggregatibacter aphrophilus ATCC 33389]MDU7785179.1 DsrH/TusB family sulfur metabolism protein [Aggregatibacter aphrophilus]OBY54952.1 hypothetical protein BBB51_03205 [Aggregatibacter aphrophilus]RDE84513.1 hypothetical protein DPW00_09655 [Aggregatibacter aphrophilus]RDE85921.1 hypothetical protein DPV90_08235 [Aggregatibacter aphrophilus]
MLYTFSQADYDQQTLEIYVRNANATDAIVLWQDGVLLAIKQADVLARCQAPCFVLENDLLARNLTALLPENAKVRSISLADFVAISEQYSPQIAL